MTPRPSRVAIWLLSFGVPSRDRDMVVGDLLEMFANRHEAGRRFNQLWLLAQAFGFAVTIFSFRRAEPLEHQSWSLIMRRVVTGLRQAVRRLAFEWRYAGAVTVIFAAGIGPAAAMLSVVDTVLMRPLSYAEPERLAMIRLDIGTVSNHPGLSPSEAIDMRQSGLFERVETQTRLAEVSMGPPSNLISLSQLSFTTGTLSMLGVQPILGRDFTEHDIPVPPRGRPAPGATPPPPPPQKALLDYGAWQQHFGGSRDVIGRLVPINGQTTEIIGVLPNGFRLTTGRAVPRRIDLYTPFQLRDLRNAWQFPTLARLKPGTTIGEVQAGLDTLAQQLKSQYPQFYEGRLRYFVVPLLDDLTQTSRPALRAAVAGVLLLLLIAFANATALVLARLRSRERDLAIRTAIGASRGALVLEVLLESVVLAAAGAVLGSVLSMGAIAGIREVMPRTVPRWEEIAVGWNLVGYAIALAAAGLALCGLIPVWRLSHRAISDALRSGAPQGDQPERATMRFVLVGAQIALTVVLAFGSVQLVRSAAELNRVSLGYEPAVLTFRVPYDFRRYPTRSNRAELYQRVRDRVAQVPGVDAAGVVTHLPLSGSTMTDGYEVDLSKEPGFGQTANYQAVSPGYFAAMRIPVLHGRDFTDQEDIQTRNVVIVDESLVRTVFPQESQVIGRTLRLGWGLANAEIVGVVGHAKTIEVGRAVRPQIYVPIGNLFQQAGHVVVRSAGDPHVLTAQITAAIDEVGPGRAVAGISMLTDNVSAATSTLRAVTGLVTFLAISAGTLSALGLYLVIAFVVYQRRRATAIRTALGASMRQVMWHHFRTSSIVMAAALVIGAGLAMVAAPLFSELLYGVGSRDAGSLWLSIAIAAAAGLLGTYIPARRAARANIVKVLHEA